LAAPPRGSGRAAGGVTGAVGKPGAVGAVPKRRRRSPRGAAAVRPGRRRAGWRKDPEGRRTRILAAAARLFGSDGYAKVRTEAIARAAGVSEGTIFHHYGSKEALLLAVAERYGRGFATAMFADLDPEGPLPDVEQVMRRAFDYVRDSDPLFGVFLLTDDPTDPTRARRANREEIVNSLTRFLGRWNARGLTRPLDPRVVAELLFGLVESALKECFARGRRVREDAYVREVVHAIRGILGVGPPVP
jgi:AcrR family transcriptional regulator